jgi:GrpB-like predicted nucleotidyltransferase (UPF0157 family)
VNAFIRNYSSVMRSACATPRDDRIMVKVSFDAYCRQWPRIFAAEARRIEVALAGVRIEVHHAGSTSVPGLRAKPIIDIVLGVPDSTDEDRYVQRLVGASYEFVLREPHWFEHRLLKRVDPKVNLHVFSTGSSEIQRMLAFRDHLRVNDGDRLLYESTKMALAERDWPTVQDYADAKSDVVGEILTRAMEAPAAGD